MLLEVKRAQAVGNGTTRLTIYGEPFYVVTSIGFVQISICVRSAEDAALNSPAIEKRLSWTSQRTRNIVGAGILFYTYFTS